MSLKKLLGASTMALALLISSKALAAPITGEITFSGGANWNAGANYTNATSISFLNPIAINEFSATGSYAGISPATTATFSGFTFGSVGTTGAVAVTPLWTFTDGATFSFNLESITQNTVEGTTRVLQGMGTAFITGMDDTAAYWSLSSSGVSTTISFSSATRAVPEGGSTIALMGLALIGLVMSRRLKASKA